MTTTRDGSRGALRLTAAGLALAAACLLSAPEARAQWTQPDASGNINSTNTGSVGVGTGASAPAGKLDVKGSTSDATAKALNIRNSTDASLFFVRNDGRVGLNTASPLAFFHVAKGDPSTGAAAFFQKDSSSGGVALGTTNNFGFLSGANSTSTASADLLINPFGGNVGIGTSAPAYKLDVVGFGRFSGAGAGISLNNSNGWTQFVASRTGSLQAAFIATPSAAYSASTPYWAMGFSPDGSAGWSLDTWDGASLITRMRMSTGGDLGIGTAAPASARLHLYSPANTYLRIGAPLANQSSIAFNDDTYGQDIVLFRPEGTRNFSLWTATAGQVFNVSQAGSVGVGTVNPGYKFDVQGGQVNASGGLCIAGDCKTAWSQVGGSQWANGTGSSINYSAGNVGIGTTSPASALFVGPGTPSVATLPGFNVALGGNSYVSASNGTVNTFLGSDTSAYGIVGTLSNHPLGLRANNTLALTVMPSGNVGIGTAAPAYKLDVTGNVNSAGLCIAGDCKTAWSQVGGSGTSQWAGGAASSINYMSGNVGIGTTTPANKLHVVGATRLDGAGRVYIGTTAAQGAPGLEFVQESPTTFSIRHHDPWVAWRNIAINPYAGNVGVNTLNPLGPLSVGDSSSDYSDGFIVLGKNNGAGGSRHFRVGFDANFNFVMGDYGNGNAAGTWVPAFAINWQAPANSLHVNSAGKVGVGTANPTEALDIVGNIKATGSVSATYQDVAEWVPSTQKLAAGTVVVLDAGKVNHVVASATSYDTKVAGVISEQPGVILGVGGEGKLKVATTGRVKVKVDASRGPILVGDLLVTSDVEGVAMKSEPINIGGRKMHAPGTIIGKALEPLEKGTGEILVLLSLQ